jgi:hypothetical protein
MREQRRKQFPQFSKAWARRLAHLRVAKRDPKYYKRSNEQRPTTQQKRAEERFRWAAQENNFDHHSFDRNIRAGLLIRQKSPHADERQGRVALPPL